MKTINICYSPNAELFEILTKNLQKDTSHWYLAQSSTESNTFYVSNISELESIFETQSSDIILRIAYVSLWKLHIASHIQAWDILLPNTFLSKKTWDACYVEYAVWENFDLEKFVLHLDGVCVDEFAQVSEEYDGDIEESQVYSFLKNLEQKWLKEKAVVVLWTQENQECYERIAAIIDLVCAD